MKGEETVNSTLDMWGQHRLSLLSQASHWVTRKTRIRGSWYVLCSRRRKDFCDIFKPYPLSPLPFRLKIWFFRSYMLLNSSKICFYSKEASWKYSFQQAYYLVPTKKDFAISGIYIFSFLNSNNYNSVQYPAYLTLIGKVSWIPQIAINILHRCQSFSFFFFLLWLFRALQVISPLAQS